MKYQSSVLLALYDRQILLIRVTNIMTSPWCSDTVYPKKYAHGFCFAVLCCGYTLTDFPISIRLTSLALWQSNDCPSASKATPMNMDKYLMWIHYERLHNHSKAKHNKTVCIFLGIYCISMVLLPITPCATELLISVSQTDYSPCLKFSFPWVVPFEKESSRRIRDKRTLKIHNLHNTLHSRSSTQSFMLNIQVYIEFPTATAVVVKISLPFNYPYNFLTRYKNIRFPSCFAYIMTEFLTPVRSVFYIPIIIGTSHGSAYHNVG